MMELKAQDGGQTYNDFGKQSTRVQRSALQRNVISRSQIYYVLSADNTQTTTELTEILLSVQYKHTNDTRNIREIEPLKLTDLRNEHILGTPRQIGLTATNSATLLVEQKGRLDGSPI